MTAERSFSAVFSHRECYCTQTPRFSGTLWGFYPCCNKSSAPLVTFFILFFFFFFMLRWNWSYTHTMDSSLRSCWLFLPSCKAANSSRKNKNYNNPSKIRCSGTKSRILVCLFQKLRPALLEKLPHVVAGSANVRVVLVEFLAVVKHQVDVDDESLQILIPERIKINTSKK